MSGRRAGRRGKGEKKQRESVGRGTETVEDEKGEEEDVRKKRIGGRRERKEEENGWKRTNELWRS